MKEEKRGLKRREIIQWAGLTLGATLLESCSSGSKNEESEFSVKDKQQVFRSVKKMDDDNPIDRSLGERSPYQFSDEDPDPSHQILWDVERYVKTLGGNLPSPTEKADVVVVGGGMAGLLTAHFLKKLDVVVLEGAGRFGGNSQGAVWGGVEYATGAQKIGKPEAGSPIDLFLKEMDLYKELKEVPQGQGLLTAGGFTQNIFTSLNDNNAKNQMKALVKYFGELREGGNGFPHMPPRNEAEKNLLKSLDQKSLYSHLRTAIGVTSFSPSVEAWLEHYCWTYLGTSSQSVSAAIGVNHMASVFGKELTAKAGNAQIAEQLLKKLRRRWNREALRSGALVFKVKMEDTRVLVSYLKEGKPATIEARAVVFACPKFVVPKILGNLEQTKETALRKLEYRSSLMGSVLLNTKLSRNLFEADIQHSPKINLKDIQAASDQDRLVHAFNGGYAAAESKNSILNVVRPFPYLTGRPQIYGAGAFVTYRKELVQQLETEVLPALQMSARSIEGLRLSRWGHGTPVAEIGKIASGEVEKIQSPIEKKIFFVNQDNWLNPKFEVIFHEAQRWAVAINEAVEVSKKASPPPAASPASSSSIAPSAAAPPTKGAQ